MESVGAVVTPVEKDILDKNLFLLAFSVKEVQEKGQQIGLRVGDILPLYESVHDVVMRSYCIESRDWYDWGWGFRELRVLREGKVITLVEKKEEEPRSW